MKPSRKIFIESGEALLKVFGILKPFLQKGFKAPGRVAEGKSRRRHH